MSCTCSSKKCQHKSCHCELHNPGHFDSESDTTECNDYIIYLLKLGGKAIYVGKTLEANFNTRMANHKSMVKQYNLTGESASPYIKEHNITDWDDIEINIVDYYFNYTDLEVCREEQYYIDKYNLIQGRLSGTRKHHPNRTLYYRHQSNKYYYKNNQKLGCDCGGSYNKINIKQHESSMRHRNYLSL